MTTSKLKEMKKSDVLDFIRERLSFGVYTNEMRWVEEGDFKKEHRRFNMTGYDNETGDCTLHNMSILNEFTDLGIYDYTVYLFLDFYKGNGTLYYRYWGDGENHGMDDDSLYGYGTTEIIYKIFEKTIFLDGDGFRRRDM